MGIDIVLGNQAQPGHTDQQSLTRINDLLFHGPTEALSGLQPVDITDDANNFVSENLTQNSVYSFALNIPAGSTHCLFEVEGGPVRARFDNTSPSLLAGGTGHVLEDGYRNVFSIVHLTYGRFRPVTPGDPTIHISFFKPL